MKKNHPHIRLLPNYCKKIGIGILVLTVLFLFLWVYKIIIADKSFLIRILNMSLLSSLLILAWSEEKIEDELTTYVRLVCLAATFCSVAIIVIIEPFSALIFGFTSVIFEKPSLLVTCMFIMYFIIFRTRLKYR